MPSDLAARLLRWYARHGRRLPWRGTRDPYRVWVSEVMLQQTRVETVIPYYRRWLRRYPGLRALARAPLQEVLAAWEGLGYYARARNLHRAAQAVMVQHGGQLPRTVEGLRALPGVGAYTAAAIASLAFGADAAVLDGNVKRVLARVFDVRLDIKSPQGEKALWALAQDHLPAGRAADYNQALMDLGATLCTPRAPACEECPLKGLCAARRLGVQSERPVSRPRPSPPVRRQIAAVIRRRGRVLLVRRPDDQLLGGLWGFPAWPFPVDEIAAAGLPALARQSFGIDVQPGRLAQRQTHAFTHFRLTQTVYDCRCVGGRARPARPGQLCRWVRPPDLGAYPMSKLDRQIAGRLQAEEA